MEWEACRKAARGAALAAAFVVAHRGAQTLLQFSNTLRPDAARRTGSGFRTGAPDAEFGPPEERALSRGRLLLLWAGRIATFRGGLLLATGRGFGAGLHIGAAARRCLHRRRDARPVHLQSRQRAHSSAFHTRPSFLR